MKAAIVVFPGTNRERDIRSALVRAGVRGEATVWHEDHDLPQGTDLVVIPGGYSYGDYLRAGAIGARSPIMRAVAKAAADGVLVLGVCNGFQILCEAGLLPGALMRNATLRFVSRLVKLKVENARTPFTRAYAPGQILQCPVAHHDGNYFADEATLDRLEGEERIVLRYVEGDNPNGSRRGIAGILGGAGNVLGMMPHPENLTEDAHGGSDGLGLFKSIAERALEPA